MGFIYCITNAINGKKYVGLTKKTIEKRFAQHKRDSQTIKMRHYPLYEAFNKYGVENFTIEELEEVDDDLLAKREMYWIEKLDTHNPVNGYNATSGGERGPTKYTQEDHEYFISLWRSGMSMKDIVKQEHVCIEYLSRIFSKFPDFKEQTEKNTQNKVRQTNGVKIDQYSMNGKYIRSYDSLADARRALGLSHSNQIWHSCNNPKSACCGYIFRYAGDPPPEPDVVRGRGRKVDQFDTDGNFIATYDNMVEAGKAVGSRNGGICGVCMGKHKICKGYVWRYHED